MGNLNSTILSKITAANAQSPPEPLLNRLELSEIAEEMEIDQKTALDWYAQFRREFPDNKISKECFDAYCQKIFPGISQALLANRIFKLYDMDNNGCLGFREFLYAISLSEGKNTDKRLKLSFKFYDEDGDGKIGLDEMEQIFVTLHRACTREIRSVEMKGKAMAKTIFDILDADRSGYITEQEFVLGMQFNKEVSDVFAMSTTEDDKPTPSPTPKPKSPANSPRDQKTNNRGSMTSQNAASTSSRSGTGSRERPGSREVKSAQQRSNASSSRNVQSGRHSSVDKRSPNGKTTF